MRHKPRVAARTAPMADQSSENSRKKVMIPALVRRGIRAGMFYGVLPIPRPQGPALTLAAAMDGEHLASLTPPFSGATVRSKSREPSTHPASLFFSAPWARTGETLALFCHTQPLKIRRYQLKKLHNSQASRGRRCQGPAGEKRRQAAKKLLSGSHIPRLILPLCRPIGPLI